jgi:hypothetical protein
MNRLRVWRRATTLKTATFRAAMSRRIFHLEPVPPFRLDPIVWTLLDAGKSDFE